MISFFKKENIEKIALDMNYFYIVYFFLSTGEIFKKRPFFTCWSRTNEKKMLESLQIAKLSKDPNIPEVRNIWFLSLLVPSK